MLDFPCIVRILKVMVHHDQDSGVRKKMRYNRVIVAKVALGAATEDEIYWVTRYRSEYPECQEALVRLSQLAQAKVSASCLASEDLIRAADTNKISEREKEHLVGCSRCASIGHYIANMKHPKSPSQRKPLSLTA